MSAWRRHAAALLPDHRRLGDSAESPVALWEQLYAVAVNGAHDDGLLRRVFQVAKDSASAEARAAVKSEFYEKLFDDETARPHLQRHLRETQFLTLEPLLATRFSADQLAALHVDFYRALAET